MLIDTLRCNRHVDRDAMSRMRMKAVQEQRGRTLIYMNENDACVTGQPGSINPCSQTLLLARHRLDM